MWANGTIWKFFGCDTKSSRSGGTSAGRGGGGGGGGGAGGGRGPRGAEVLRQAGCENFLTMGFSSPSGIKRAPGDLNCTPFVGQYTITFYIIILTITHPANTT